MVICFFPSFPAFSIPPSLSGLVISHLLILLIFLKKLKKFSLLYIWFFISLNSDLYYFLPTFPRFNILFFSSFPGCFPGASLVAQMVKHLPPMRETQVQSLGREDPLEKDMAPHSSTLAWKIPWRKLVGCSLWGLKELDTTERFHFHFLLASIDEYLNH